MILAIIVVVLGAKTNSADTDLKNNYSKAEADFVKEIAYASTGIAAGVFTLISLPIMYVMSMGTE